MPSTSIDPQPKKLQEAIQQDFPVVPTNRRGANRFKGGSFQKSTWNASGKPNVKPPSTSDPIQVSSDLESPHKRLREVSAEELEPDREVKSEPIPSHKPSCYSYLTDTYTRSQS
jgi:hypothetical protein